ncbi:hypothetical protein T10_7510 [Trichinella papuae]|uniref:Uncharacterized protein n=1 Tax=Trichinella papuae TaxID=268474 RepID=A0A0V1MIB1_9BILA|nr:hypothetical protein T10_7510 [Trichinella papuae]
MICVRSDFPCYYTCTHLVLRLYYLHHHPFKNVKVRCLEDPEMEEYVGDLEELAESLSDNDDVEEEGIFINEMNVNIDVEESAGPTTRTILLKVNLPHPSRRPAENILRDKAQ